jgi:O-antigen ligase
MTGIRVFFAVLVILVISAITVALLGPKAILIPFLVLIILLSLRYGTFALAFYFAAIPFVMLFFSPIYIAVSVAAAVLIIFLWILRKILIPDEVLSIPNTLTIFALLFLASGFISGLHNGLTGAEQKTLIRLVIFFIFVFVIYDQYRFKHTHLLFVAMTIPLIFSAVMLFKEYSQVRSLIDFLNLYRLKPGGIFPNSNILGHVLMVIAPFWIALAIWHRNKAVRYISIAIAFLLSAAIILTNARAAIFGFAVSSIMFFYWTRRLKLLFIIILLTAIILILSPSLMNLISLGLRLERGTTSRTEIWANAIDMIKHNPILGIGPGTFSESYIPYFQTGWEYGFCKTMPNAHFFILNLTTELGLPGLLLSLIICILPIREGIRALGKSKFIGDRAIVYAIIVSIFAIIAHSFFEAGGIIGSGRPYADILFWLLFCILIKVNRLPNGYSERIFS